MKTTHWLLPFTHGVEMPAHLSVPLKRSGEARRRFTFPDRIGVVIVSLIMLVFLASFMYECVSILHARFMVWLVVVAIISFAVVTINILLNLPEHVP